MDKTAATAATPKPKTVVAKPAPVAPHEATIQASGAPLASGGGDGGAGASDGASTHRSIRRREFTVQPEAGFSPPVIPVIALVVAEPVVKEPSVEEIAAVKVGATSHELEAALGAPESRVSIPDDDGHLLEICQYWSKGQPLGTIRLDNGRVVSVQTRSY